MNTSVNRDAITFICPQCGRSGPISAAFADQHPDICAQCQRDRTDAVPIRDHQNSDGITADVDARELMRLADDGGPAIVGVDIALPDVGYEDAFSNQYNAASKDDAPAGAGSREGSRDADGSIFFQSGGKSDEQADAPVSRAATRATCDAPQGSTTDRCTRSAVADVWAGAGESSAPALLSSSEAGACTHHAPAAFGGFVGGDLTSLPARSIDVDAPSHRRGRIFSDNLIAPGAGDWLRMWRGVGRIAC